MCPVSVSSESFSHTMEYLYSQLPMYQQQGQTAIRKGLRNIERLCGALGDPQLHYPSLHIAGTNGKGSTAQSLAALLTHAGYRIGLYTSPHLRHFGERIQINLQAISESEITAYTNEFKPLIKAYSPSFFEISCAMALCHFARQEVDLGIIETGLGGRLDSTNIISPLLSVVTNVSLDHEEILGHSLPQIAYEKAGIIKKQVPVLLGPVSEDVLGVFSSEAAQKRAPLLRSTHYSIHTVSESWQHRIVDVYKEGQLRYKRLQIGLLADYYLENLSIVCAALDELASKGFRCSEKQLRSTMRGFSMQGRFDVIEEQPLSICDVAHNLAGLGSLFSQLRRRCRGRRWHLIFGLSKEKKSLALFDLLPREALYYVTQAQVPRACDASSLAAEMSEQGLSVSHYACLSEAYLAARRAAQPKDLLLICGSAYLVGEFYTHHHPTQAKT